MKINVQATPVETALAVAQAIITHLDARPDALLCLAGGDTPMPVYRCLIEAHRAGEVDLHKAWYVALDEWVGLGYEDEGSCKQMMYDGFYLPAGIPLEHIVFFDGKAADIQAEARRVAAFIERQGGITLALLGIGMNGHIGFNEPGRRSDAIAAVVDLDETTVSVGRKYFKDGNTPGQGVTVTVSGLTQADEVLYMVTDAHKRAIVQRILDSAPTPDIPATMLKTHPDLTIFLDLAARAY